MDSRPQPLARLITVKNFSQPLEVYVVDVIIIVKCHFDAREMDCIFYLLRLIFSFIQPKFRNFPLFSTNVASFE